jgi:hypothetical protein
MVIIRLKQNHLFTFRKQDYGKHKNYRNLDGSFISRFNRFKCYQKQSFYQIKFLLLDERRSFE